MNSEAGGEQRNSSPDTLKQRQKVSQTFPTFTGQQANILYTMPIQTVERLEQVLRSTLALQENIRSEMDSLATKKSLEPLATADLLARWLNQTAELHQSMCEDLKKVQRGIQEENRQAGKQRDEFMRQLSERAREFRGDGSKLMNTFQRWAAVCFLKDLYKIYEDWILVIAAYNCGPGNVNKAIRRSGSKKNYWDIYFHLPKETRGYVPAFIAAMYTFNYHKEHNIFPLENELPTMCDTIMISDALHFEQVAKLMDISVEQIRDLNPQYRSDIVPAGFGKSYALQVPYNHVGEFIDKQDTIFAYNRTTYFNDSDRTADPKNRFKKYAHAHAVPSNKAKLVYTVKSGDVIGKIAEKFNVRLSDLKYWNGMTRDRINIGQKLTVYVPNNKVDYYKSKVNAKYAGIAANAEVEAEPLTEGEFFYYTIKRGENLWSIAKKYPGVSNRDIMKWNGLTDRSAKNLKPGQKLKIKI